MLVFEWTLLLLAGAVALTAMARRLGAPYPSLLAIGGAGLALVNYSPEFQLDPSLVLALFVAPVLLDTAFDTSLRDLRANWIPVVSLVVIAVVITTAAVAALVHAMVPAIPWAAAIALGAIVAPPDAAAATAVLRPLHLPHRLVVILEGESLLNDASALLIYRFAVATLMAQAAGGWELAPRFLLSIAGSVLLGYMLTRVVVPLMRRVGDAPSQIVLQFVGTFGIWLLADHLGLSPIVTVVVYGLAAARYAAGETPARLRVPSFAVWETIVFVLNVLAFVLIGLQVRPILAALEPAQRLVYLRVALAVLFVVIVVRAGWIATYMQAALWKAKRFGGGRWPGPILPTWRGAAIVSWCGMRGIVTLAAAYALPMRSAVSPGVPYRDLIVVCAFGVVVGTLVLQGLTLRPLIALLRIAPDHSIDQEVHRTMERLARVALDALQGDHSSEARALRRELTAEIDRSAREDLAHQPSTHEILRARIVAAQRLALVQMRDAEEIGDDAFHQVEERLDWAELNAQAIEEA
ncbi:MAG TPA: sodium:proton antiporter [Vicinamibacterales bacterium]|nr:sodium:proton antiporter [Vicinamibacterales bacterium]